MAKGYKPDPLRKRWEAMRSRCRNPKNPSFHNYGGRGIKIDPEWESFPMFAIWAYYSGFRPELQLDRIDNDGPYSPDNCRWVTPAANSRNRRPNRWHSFFGEEMVALDAARKYGLNHTTVLERLNRGDSPEDAVRPVGCCHEYFGERLSYAAAERKYGVKWQTIRWRIHSGQTPEEAVSKPSRQAA